MFKTNDIKHKKINIIYNPQNFKDKYPGISLVSAKTLNFLWLRVLLLRF